MTRARVWVMGLLLAACAPAPPAATPVVAPASPDGATVPPDAAAAVAVAPAPPDAAVAATSNQVRGIVFMNPKGHCGGARLPPPPPDAPPPPHPVAGGRTLEVSGPGGSTKVTSDAHGGFVLTLAPGSYCVRDSARANASLQPSQYVDADCLANWKKDCDARFKVPVRAPVQVELYETCFGPCYRGPLPP